MNEKALKTLEYNKIIDKLVAFAGSELGRERCKKLLPMTDIGEIRRNQQETSDALTRVLRKGSLSFSGLRDIRASIMRLEVGGVLGMGELLQVSSVLNVALRVKSYGRSEGSEEETAIDSLRERFSLLEPLSPLNNEIKRCILSEEEMSDDASPTLRHIRRSIKLTNDRVREQLNTIVNASSNQTMLQENIVTMRNGRYCLPIKAEYKSQFNGMVHDQSSSGSTLFIEPMAVVKLNNELRELAVKENDEIERILAELSNQAGEYCQELKDDITILAELDFIFAKASLSKGMRASEPVFNDKG
ncbi:MAG: endonuclease MutS2, partial [Acetivibrio ethanolgignens]